MTQMDTEGGLAARKAAAKSIGLTPEHAMDIIIINGIPEYRPVVPAKMGSGQSARLPEMKEQLLQNSLAAQAENQG